jgi:ABC-type glycerol-3-phosphate transport system substrate-binding protein
MSTLDSSQQTSATQGPSRRDAIKLLGGIGILGLLGSSAAGCATSVAKKSTPGNTSNTIRYWTFLKSGESDDPRTKAQGMILDAFRKRNPDIKVVEEVLPWTELQPALLRAATAGQAGDVSIQLDQYVKPLAQAGAILPLDDYTSGWDQGRKDDFLYPLADTTVNGKVYAFRHPLRVPNLMYYRPSLFKAAGVEVPSGEFVPAGGMGGDFSRFTQLSRQLTKGRVVGFLQPFSKADNLNRFMQTCPSLFWALGSDLVDPKTGRPMFHLEAGVKIFQWFQDMVHQARVSPVGEVTMDSEAGNTMFQSGTLATTWQHSSQWSEWFTAVNGDLGTTTMPTPDGGTPTAPTSSEGGHTLVMSKNANRDAAWKLIEFFQSEEAELIDATVAGQLPTRKSNLADGFFKSDKFSRQAAWLEYFQANAHAATTIIIEKRREFADILGDAAQRIISTKSDVASTLSRAADQYASLVGVK